MFHPKRYEETAKLRRTDLLILNVFSLKILGICPFERRSFFSIIYPYLSLGGLQCLVFCTILKEILSCQMFIIFEKIMELITLGALFIFNGSLIYSHLKCHNDWKILFHMLKEFDRSSSKTDIMFEQRKLDSFIPILFLIGPVLCSSMNYYLLTTGELDNEPFVFAVQNCGFFYEFQIAALFWEAACVFQSRYRILEEHLQLNFFRKEKDEDFAKYMFRNEIQNIKHRFKLLYHGVEAMNTIFRWILLFLLSHIVASILLDFLFLLELLK